ncbi:flagellin [Puniceicoccaceae bacterium K14]|nr:flagellin [Puniceicoccaceae bacterium K14]
MVINTNSAAVDAASTLNRTNEAMHQSLTRLSSGMKIVRPADDAAGLSISEKLEAQSTRINAARVNTQNAASLVQTADGFLSSMNGILDRMSELSILAKDATNNSSDLELYRVEFDSLKDQLRDIVGNGDNGTDSLPNWNTSNTEPSGKFNGIILFGAREDMTFVVGTSGDQTMSIAETNLREVGGAFSDILWDSDVGGDSASGGQDNIEIDSPDAVEALKNALNVVASERAKVGAVQSRLETVNAQLTIESENLEAANSRIRDVDVADESTKLARSNILIQSGTAMLQQANSLPENVLRLLR